MSVFYFAAVILLISHHVVSSPAHVQIVSPFSPRRSNFPLDNVSSQEDGDRSVSEQDMDYLIPPDRTTSDKLSDSLIESNDVDSLSDESESNELDTTSADTINHLIEEIKDEEDIAFKSAYLMKLLLNSSNGPLPVLYVEEPTEVSFGLNKRSGRYYRRYPWKRQNSKYRTYEADSRYQCVPTRDDVFKLLVGLHENRSGNHKKTVSFCNRKRPAKAIFTNIRFLG